MLKKITLIGSMLVAAGAHADTNFTIYGVIDIAAQDETNAKADGSSIVRVTSGATGGSRLGFKASQDIDYGLKVNFKLEAGFLPDTGAQSDASRLFNREAWVGLQNDFGEIRAGRQYNVLFEHFAIFDPMYAVSNVAESVPYLSYAAGDDPVHKDNAVRLGATLGNAHAGLMLAPGEGSSGRYIGLVGNYTKGSSGFGAFFEQRNPKNADDPAWTTITDAGFGGSYDFGGGVVVMANYQHHNHTFAIPLKLEGSLYNLGATYQVTEHLSLLASDYFDRQHNGSGLDARRNTLALSAYYQIGPKTGVYVYGDTTRWKNGYVEILGDDYGQKAKRENYMVGLRHAF